MKKTFTTLFDKDEIPTIRGGGTNSLTKKHSWDMVKVKQVNNENNESGGKQPYQQNRIYDAEGLAPALNKGKSDIIIKSNTKAGEEIFSEGDTLNYSNSNSNSKTRRGRVGKGVAQTIDTGANQAVIVAQRGRYNAEGKIEQQTNTLTGVSKDNMVYVPQDTIVNTNMSGESFENEHAGSLRANASSNYQLVNNIRRLTEVECERLQTFPDQWTQYGCYPTKKVSQEQFNKMTNEERISHFKSTEVKKVPKSQRYKLCG